MPAPLGPISAVTLPGTAVRATSVAALTPPNAIVSPLTTSDGRVAAAEECREVEVGGGCGARRRARQITRKRSENAFRRQPQHDEQQHAEDQQAVFRKRRDQLREQDDDEGADHGAERVAGATDDNGEQEQDRLRERERTRRDEGHQRGERATSGAGDGRGKRKRDRLDDDGIAADRLGGGLAVAYGDHRLAERAQREAVKERQRGAGHHDRERRKAALAVEAEPEPWLRDIHEAVLAAGHCAPLDENVLDDERERDGHHREVRTGHAKRRYREQCPDRARDESRRRQRQPEADVARGHDADDVGADRVKSDVADGDLPCEADEDVEASADDCRQRYQCQQERRVTVTVDREGETGNGERKDGTRHGERVTPHRVKPS